MIGENDGAKDRRHGAGEPASGEQTPAVPSGEGESTAAGAAPPSQAEAGALAELRSENAALKDRLLRALAETENVRRRAERDLGDARQYAVTRFARDLLPVADNMERAMASAHTEAHRGENLVKALVEGVDLTGKELLRVLERHGVRKLVPVGERFDPNFHEALFEVPDPAVPDGTVSQVVEPGYAIGTRPLRPAKVGIARGGPSAKASPAASATEAQASPSPRDPKSGTG
ncbi:nucleotide exchange factor GrpE [uncultured Bosea sp.]|uniref:nucleotide exchange factor GrpE n=1 Tax=uncultured Bosea sp. TaxID=211457 RepID=UPI0025E8EE13|nr:nucleotide exchange factor GrpE [uncultured Bosea sp.]